MGGNEVRQFLNYLALDRKVVAATQNQALNALVFKLLIIGSCNKALLEQLGHKDIRATQIYTHVLKQGTNAVTSPLNELFY